MKAVFVAFMALLVLSTPVYAHLPTPKYCGHHDATVTPRDDYLYNGDRWEGKYHKHNLNIRHHPGNKISHHPGVRCGIKKNGHKHHYVNWPRGQYIK